MGEPDQVLVEIVVPQVGEAIAEVEFVQWLVETGGRLVRGTPMFEVDTDKTVVSIDASVDGTLVSKSVHDGDLVMPRDRIGVALVDRGDVTPDMTILAVDDLDETPTVDVPSANPHPAP